MPEPSEQFLTLYRANLEGMVRMARTALDEAERLRTRQLEAIRDAVTENAELAAEIASARTLEELLTAQAKFASHQLDVTIGYWSKLFEAASRTQLDTVKRIEEQAGRINESISHMLDAAPAGAEPMVSAMRSMLEAARAAYGIGAQATEQAARLTEAQFSTATAGIREAVANARKKTA
jgi:phasin family protein